MSIEARPVVTRSVGAADGSLLLDLFVVQQRVGELLDAALRPTGVRAAEYAVISLLGTDVMTPGELGTRLGTTKSTLTGHLAALERRGQLRRRRHPEDGRSSLLELTEDGLVVLEDCRTRFRATLATFESELTHSPTVSRDVLLDIDGALARAIARIAD